jgi:hypothetical protein
MTDSNTYGAELRRAATALRTHVVPTKSGCRWMRQVHPSGDCDMVETACIGLESNANLCDVVVAEVGALPTSAQCLIDHVANGRREAAVGIRPESDISPIHYAALLGAVAVTEAVGAELIAMRAGFPNQFALPVSGGGAE